MSNENLSFENSAVYIDLYPIDNFIIWVNNLIIIWFEKTLRASKIFKSSRRKSRKKSTSYQESFKSLIYVAAFVYSPKDREAALGDLEENYHNNCKKFDKKRAYKLLLWDISLSILSRLKELFGKPIIKIIKFIGAYGIYRCLLDIIRYLIDIFRR